MAGVSPSPPADADQPPLRLRHGKATKVERKAMQIANANDKRPAHRKTRIRCPNGHKIARVESMATSYDTNTIPSASSGFAALPDGGHCGSKVHEARELLDGENFKVVEWNGTYVLFSSAVDSNSRAPRLVRAIVDKDGGDNRRPGWPSQ